MKGPHARLRLLAILLASPAVMWAQGDSTPALAPIGTEAFEVMREFFEYDRSVPLAARTIERLEEEAYVREKIVFRGAGDSRVPGYLAIPAKGVGPYPCVLLLHGIGSDKDAWWQDESFSSGGRLTKELVAAGFAVLALDAEYHGERLQNNDFESPIVFTFEHGWIRRARDMIVQSTVDYRRAIDYLGTRADIDTSRVGAIGYSMGGMMVFGLSAVDPRIRASVASVTPILKEAHSAIAVHNFAPFIRRPALLMLMGETDQRNYSPDDARRVHGLVASGAKELVFYESGHQLPSEWTSRAAAWMARHLE
ncbi:MAG: alpha/beta fold hydrolase [Gemmatimonadales bacterium]